MARLGQPRGSQADGAAYVPHGYSPTLSGRWLIVVLDTGGVEGVTPIDEERRVRLRLLRERAEEIVLPAAVLAESVLTGHPGHGYFVQRLLATVHIVDVDAMTGYAAGALRRAAITGGIERHAAP